MDTVDITKPIRVRQVFGWWEVRADNFGTEWWDTFEDAISHADAIATVMRARAAVNPGATASEIKDIAQHLREWDERHRLDGRRKVWPRVRDWWRAHPYHQLMFWLLLAALVAVAIVLLWPHQPDSILPPDLGRPDRPPHPRSIYTPKGG